jgi:predicted DNA-binding transcriptional regulator YafY
MAGNEGRLMTEREAAAYLRVSPRTLRRYRTEKPAGTGPPVAGYVGRSPRYRRADLDAWLKRGQEGT